jgi:hypothetical protein
MSEWTRKQRGWYFSLLPSGTWTARRYHGKWLLFYLPIDGRTEPHGEFPRLRAAKRYAAISPAKAHETAGGTK